MKSPSGSFQPVGAQRVCVVLLTILALASAGFAQTITSGEKAKVKGTITSRKGDLVKIQDDKTGSPVLVKITDDTKISSRQIQGGIQASRRHGCDGHGARPNDQS